MIWWNSSPGSLNVKPLTYVKIFCVKTDGAPGKMLIHVPCFEQHVSCKEVVIFYYFLDSWFFLLPIVQGGMTVIGWVGLMVKLWVGNLSCIVIIMVSFIFVGWVRVLVIIIWLYSYILHS